MSLEDTDLTEEIESLEVGDVEEATFFGKEFGDMERHELLAAINWFAQEREGLQSKAKEMEEKFIEAAKEAGY